MSKLIMSGEKPEIMQNVAKFGFEIITSEALSEFLLFEKSHADMQCLKIKDTLFVLKNCKTLSEKLKTTGLNVVETEKFATEKYPENVLLNCLYIKGKLYCKESAIDKNVKAFCLKENIEIVNVNQGYTKCSTAVIDDSFFTSDTGIYNALKQNGVEGILIKSGEIQLDGVDYGFIGGCCFSDKDNVYFTGDITKHSNYGIIEEFCHSKNKNIISLTNKKLYDIGGFIEI